MDNSSPEKTTFDFDKANLSDQITVIGNLEHLYMHLLKSASTLEEDEAVFYLTLAQMVKEYRREFMREHFPSVEERDWCVLKAVETVRQRVYESANTSHKNLKEINDIWGLITEHIFGVDMSGCSACKEDKEKNEEEPTQKE